MPNRCLIVISASVIAFGAGPAIALVIDNFEEGAALVADSGLNDLIPPIVPVPTVVGTTAEQIGLSTANVAGGVRLVAAVATDPLATLPDLPVDPTDVTGLILPIPPTLTATATAVLAAPLPGLPDDGMQFATLGGGAFRLIYDGNPGGAVGSGRSGNLNLDLSGFNAVELTALGVTGAALGAPPEIRLSLYDDVRVQSSAFVDVAEGVNLIALSAFPLIDLSNIKQILVDIRGITTTSTMQLTNIQAVPEPGPGLLVALGLSALAARRRSTR